MKAFFVGLSVPSVSDTGDRVELVLASCTCWTSFCVCSSVTAWWCGEFWRFYASLSLRGYPLNAERGSINDPPFGASSSGLFSVLWKLCVRASLAKRFSFLGITDGAALVWIVQVSRPPFAAFRPWANPQHNSIFIMRTFGFWFLLQISRPTAIKKHLC